ncbi:MAG: hypothetical protein LBI28_01625 [Treponema sp.]|jgi:hypothetical protein|nr:hypothetical protein [Treponema sp.]
METTKNRKIFLVLVPHRDIRLKLKEYSEKLLKAGLTGVYNFPWVAPLAELSHPLKIDELKNFSKSLRETAKDKMSASSIARTQFLTDDNMTLLGSRIDLSVTAAAFKTAEPKIKNIILPTVIGSFLLPADLYKEREQLLSSLPPCEEISFRAAAVANMYWRPFQSGGKTAYKWRIGRLCWLPRYEQ